ncbi:hypothetical protein Tco_1165852 [Tanacetum coccineum]
MSPKNKDHYESEKEAIHLILIGIGDEIYSTVDACKATHEMWKAIKRLQQGESLNIQDVKTNLFWEFGKFTSYDGETIESYYTRFYKPMDEMIRNNLTVDKMQVNVQFLQQLQPEWSRTTQKDKGKCRKIWLSLQSTSRTSYNLHPNNNLRTSSNTRNKNVDTTPRYKNDNQNRNQRAVNVAGARDTVGGQVMQQSGIQCFNFKEFGHFANMQRKSKHMCDNDIQNDQNALECDNERIALANLIANLNLDVDENKKIQKQLKKSNASLTTRN